MKTVFTVEHIRSGQPRAYADTERVDRIKGERHGWFTDGRVLTNYYTEDEIKQIAKVIAHSWCEDGEGDWASSKLDYCKPVGESPGKDYWKDGKVRSTVWEIRVVEAYTD